MWIGILSKKSNLFIHFFDYKDLYSRASKNDLEKPFMIIQHEFGFIHRRGHLIPN
jgi:hypothetical protein